MDAIYALEHSVKCILYEWEHAIYLVQFNYGKIYQPKILATNYQRELTSVQVGNEIYYAYINISNEVEIASVSRRERNIILTNSSARCHYRNIKLCYRFREVFLLYTCYEPVRNMYILGAIYPFPGKKEEVIRTSTNRRMHYDVFVAEDGLFLKIYNAKEKEPVLKKGPMGFYTQANNFLS